MAQINLLPWREERRKEQNVEFATWMGIGVGITVLLMALAHFHFVGLIDHQLGRNQILEKEIKRLDAELEKIKGLEETKAKLLSRMEIIQSLQQKRPQIVHLFDDMARAIPEGLFLTDVKQAGPTLTITGIAESNGRVSAYMRNIDTSDWMTQPRLQVIETMRKDGRGSKFVVIAQQSTPKKDAENATDKAEEQ